MDFKIGQKFYGVYPVEAAVWCNENNAHIEEITGGYKIVANYEITEKELIDIYERAVQDFLDETAQSRGYDSTYTCLSYLISTDEKWRREANAFNAWRDSVWRKCHYVIAQVKAGQMEKPTISELLRMLPEIDWEDPE